MTPLIEWGDLDGGIIVPIFDPESQIEVLDDDYGTWGDMTDEEQQQWLEDQLPHGDPTGTVQKIWLGPFELVIRPASIMIKPGEFFVDVLLTINVPELTGVDNWYLEQNYQELSSMTMMLPSFELLWLGKNFWESFFPIEETRNMNRKGKPTTWLRLLLFAVIVFVFLTVVLILGWKAGKALMLMIPGAASLVMGLNASMKTKTFRTDVIDKLDKLDIDLEYLTGLIQGTDLVPGLIQLVMTLILSLGKLSFI